MAQVPYNPKALESGHCQTPTGPRQLHFRQGSKSAFQIELKGAQQANQPSGPTSQRISHAVNTAAKKHGIPANLIRAVMKQESAFKPNAKSHCGAQGLMQLMPGTAKEMGVKDAYNIEQNIDGGAKYLSRMLKTFGGNTKLALAAYNAGPGAVMKHNGVPPYKETQNYVARISASLKGNVAIPNDLPKATPATQAPAANTLVAEYNTVDNVAGPGQIDTNQAQERIAAAQLTSEIMSDATRVDLPEETEDMSPLPPHAIKA